MTCKTYTKFTFQFSLIKLYWHTVTPIHLHIVFGCFCAHWQSRIVATETTLPTELKIYYLAFWRKSLETSELDNKWVNLKRERRKQQ